MTRIPAGKYECFDKRPGSPKWHHKPCSCLKKIKAYGKNRKLDSMTKAPKAPIKEKRITFSLNETDNVLTKLSKMRKFKEKTTGLKEEKVKQWKEKITSKAEESWDVSELISEELKKRLPQDANWDDCRISKHNEVYYVYKENGAKIARKLSDNSYIRTEIQGKRSKVVFLAYEDKTIIPEDIKTKISEKYSEDSIARLEKQISLISALPKKNQVKFTELFKKNEDIKEIKRICRLMGVSFEEEDNGIWDELDISLIKESYSISRKNKSSHSSATVWEDKKSQDPLLQKEAKKSSFGNSDKFGHIEIDDSVDIDKFRQVSAEWEKIENFLPVASQKVHLRFRKTGRHKALGIYSASNMTMAVDPRHPSSFVHEYIHHIDNAEGDLCLQPEFQKIAKEVQSRILESKDKEIAKKRDYYSKSTEIMSRSFEKYLHWKGISTSLNDSKENHGESESEPYKVLDSQKKEIIDFWDNYINKN